MKATKLTLLLTAIALNMNAQVKLLPNGNFGIGTTDPETKLEVDGGQFQVTGKNNIYLKDNTSSDPGDIVFYSSTAEMARIWRLGSYMYIRASNSGYGAIRIRDNDNVGIGILGSASYKLYVGGDIYVTGSYLPSDIKLKKNIKDISSPIEQLSKLQGISYEYDLDKMNLYRQDKINSMRMKDSLTSGMEIKEEYNTECFNTKKMGFVAQDFQKVFPDLVKVDEDSLLSIDYIGLIPVLVEAIKTQQDKIDELEKKINKGSLKIGTNQSSTNPDDIVNLENAVLYQNSPNPFSDKTEIEFFLPDEISEAQLIIYNMQGLQIKSYALIQKGNSYITVNGYELNAGMYMYTLIADGKEIDTKRMILTD